MIRLLLLLFLTILNLVFNKVVSGFLCTGCDFNTNTCLGTCNQTKIGTFGKCYGDNVCHHECIKRDLDRYFSLVICNLDHDHDYCQDLSMITAEIRNPNYYEYLSSLILNLPDVNDLSPIDVRLGIDKNEKWLSNSVIVAKSEYPSGQTGSIGCTSECGMRINLNANRSIQSILLIDYIIAGQLNTLNLCMVANLCLSNYFKKLDKSNINLSPLNVPTYLGTYKYRDLYYAIGTCLADLKCNFVMIRAQSNEFLLFEGYSGSLNSNYTNGISETTLFYERLCNK